MKINWPFRWSRRPLPSALFHPRRDWHILLAVAGLGLVLVLGLYFQLGQKLNELEKSFLRDGARPAEYFTETELREIVDGLDQQQAELDFRRQSPEKIADPSL